MHKVIALDQRIKIIKGVEVDLYLEMRGLLTLIYDRAKRYDGYLVMGDKEEAKNMLDGIKILGNIFHATIQEQFEFKDKLALIGEAESLCLRMMQESKDETIRKTCYALIRKYNHMNNDLMVQFMTMKNTPTD